MAEDTSRSIFEKICNVFDSKNYKYKKDDDKLRIDIAMSASKCEMRLLITVDEERSIVIFKSDLPFKFAEDKRTAGAIAVCELNYSFCAGMFNTDVRSGYTFFKLVTPYKGSQISESALSLAFELSCQMIYKYFDRLTAVNNGALDPYNIVC